MSKLSLEQKLRTGHVKRWQIVRVAREQTIAEHMYRVHLIAKEIGERASLSEREKRLVTEWSLIHDIPEVVTGDIATPTKRAMRQAVPDSDPVRHIELSLDEDYKDVYEHCKTYSPIVLEVVKIADLIEAIDFLEIDGMGPHAADVKVGLKKSLFEKMDSLKEEFPAVHTAGYNIFFEVCVGHKHSEDGVYPVTK